MNFYYWYYFQVYKLKVCKQKAQEKAQLTQATLNPHKRCFTENAQTSPTK